MMKWQRKYRSKRGGFTLLEVLLVVGILALLAAFVVPNLIRTSDEAKIGIAKTYVGRNGNIARALNKYRLDVGVYPDTDEGLEALYERPNSIDDDDERWKGPYMEGTPEELRDPWLREFQYRSPGEFNEEGFDLWSLGPLEKDDEDDIKNWREK
ncbi:MAG: type II secretion system major pseudopilin GspG [bacterium]|nr:type II secretion system major pseudopilin GspG [bacterium]